MCPACPDIQGHALSKCVMMTKLVVGLGIRGGSGACPSRGRRWSSRLSGPVTHSCTGGCPEFGDTWWLGNLSYVRASWCSLIPGLGTCDCTRARLKSEDTWWLRRLPRREADVVETGLAGPGIAQEPDWGPRTHGSPGAHYVQGWNPTFTGR
jgi:hypothetical protein